LALLDIIIQVLNGFVHGHLSKIKSHTLKTKKT